MTVLARVCRYALPGAIALTLLHASAAQPQDSRAQELQTGTVTERHRVLIQLLGRPSSARSVSEWNALTAELQRVHGQVQAFAGLTGNDLPAIGLTSDDTSRLRHYYSDLAAAVGQSKDPTVVPLLLQCLDAGPSAEYALARFGDTAVDGLLATARALRDYDHVSGAFETLTAMYDSGQAQPLSTHSQQAIVVYLHEAWIPSPLRVPIQALAALSLATGDQQLRAIVTQLARDPTAVAARVAGSTWHPDLVLDDLNELLRHRIGPLGSDVAALRSGDDGQIENALWHILYTPSGDRSLALWKAVGDAFIRRQRHPPRPDPGNADPEDGVAQLFVQVLTQSRNPVVIQSLLAALGRAGWPAWDTLARFGDQSIAPLIRVARGGQSSKRSGALFALARFLDHPIDDPVFPMSVAGRLQIVSFARQVWRRPRLNADAIPLTELALATGDPELRQAVTALAADPAGLRHAGVDNLVVQNVQHYMERALNQHPAR